jgi:hypothetical protein
MGLTYEQCKQLGIEHLHPLHSGLAEQAERSRAVREDLDLAPSKPQRTQPADGMNKTERSFSETLVIAKSRTLIVDWYREPVKLRLAGRTWYTPDFLVECFDLHEHEPLTFIEVKGWMRDDAAVKLKVAARTYQCFRWLLVTRYGLHGWTVREVTHTGIGTTPITVPWIGGAV